MFGQLADTDLKALRTFYTIVTTGGFTHAQAELGISAATVSTQMARLEHRLGLRLCQRGHLGFKLTTDGEKVFRSCERLFTSIEDFKSELAETSEILTGELRVGLINNSITHPGLRINDAIAGYNRIAPNVRIVLFVGLETDVEARVLDRRLHVGITFVRELISQLDYNNLVREDFVMYCGKGHDLFSVGDDEISLAMLAMHQFVSRDYWERTKWFTPPFQTKNGADTPEVEGMAQLILSGRFIGYLPTHYAEQWVVAGQMKPLLPDQTKVSGDIAAITLKSAESPRILGVFLKYLSQAHSN